MRVEGCDVVRIGIERDDCNSGSNSNMFVMNRGV